MLLLTLDLLGTFVFSLTGGLKAVKHNLDFLGIIVLSILTGLGGGLIRDVILNNNHPQALKDEKYLILCIFGGIFVFFSAKFLMKFLKLLSILDAVGLGVFASLGSINAYSSGLGFIGVCLMAMLTATGGGIIRDLMVNEIPTVIKTDFYATATIIGASSLFLTKYLNFTEPMQIWVVIILTITVRLTALTFNVNLPKARA